MLDIYCILTLFLSNILEYACQEKKSKRIQFSTVMHFKTGVVVNGDYLHVLNTLTRMTAKANLALKY